ncbi:uncharacterized protein LOC130112872 [Lampris incognitus]|uniref:uncharacterized protein LOC130112872 n=1 Tax=Lampris incognitus TaxID=2546036 RepID=UPI0024B51769|nr:uncharacterized protein LOC130112872 [Lampris incognitus]
MKKQKIGYSDLFAGLPAEDVARPCGPAPPDSDLSAREQNAKRTCARKRQLSEELNAKRKQQNTKTKKGNASHIHPSKPRDYRVVKHECGQTSVDFTKELDLCRYDGKVDQNDMDHKGQHHPTKNNQKKHRQSNRWGPTNRTGCHRANRRSGTSIKGRGSGTSNKGRGRRSLGCAIRGGDLRGKADQFKNAPVEQRRVMTQEFKDQNALEVDGRLICRHFLWGKCIKGDECQLEHAQGYNNLFKEVCKFYVQGFCTKGESCPYMHDSFPCKFFHKWGTCSQGPACRFSHTPLTDLTKQLLDEVLKKDYELSVQNRGSGEPENTEENMTPDDTKPDICLHPIRPNFYNSSCPTEPLAETEALMGQTTGLANVAEDAISPPCITAATHPPNLLSHSPSCKELVSYSVEAVLGSQKSQNFPSLFAVPRGQDSGACSSPQTFGDCAPSSGYQNEAPHPSGGRIPLMKRPFHSLFANPVTDNPKQQFPLRTTSELAKTTPHLNESTPTDRFSTTTFGKTATTERRETTERPSLCLSVGPVIKTTPLPPVKAEPVPSEMPSIQPAVCTSYSQHGTQMASTSKRPFQDLFAGLISNDLLQTLTPPKSPDSLPRCERKKSEKSNVAVHINKCPKKVAKPTCRNVSNSFSEMSTDSVYINANLETSRAQAQQQLPDGSSQNASSKSTAADFKTLFLQLSPYCQDGERGDKTQSKSSLGSKNGEQKSTGSVSTKQLKRGEEKGRNGEMKAVELKETGLGDEPVENLLNHRHQLQSSHILSAVKTAEALNRLTHNSLEAEGGSTSMSMCVKHIPVRCPGMHRLPVRPVASKAQPQARTAPEQKCRKKEQRTGNTGGTGLKKLFMTLDPTASPFGK